MKEVNEIFLMDKSNYEKIISTNHKFNSRYIMQFIIFLPYYFPIEDYEWFLTNEYNNTMCFMFKKVINQRKVFIADKDVETANSVVEMSITINDEINIEKIEQKYLNNCFNLLLDKLNEIITGYRLHSKDETIYTLRTNMLEFATIYRVINTQNWVEINSGLMILNMNVPYVSEIVKNEDKDEILRMCNIIASKTNPFINSVNFFINAKMFFKQGFYEESVLNSQIAVEVFIKTLLRELLKAEGKSDTEIDTFIEETPFMSMIKRELSNRLGGIWDITKLGTPINNWYSSTYLLRDRVTHAGYNPCSEEVIHCIDCSMKFTKYIENLIMYKKNLYPKISLYFEDKIKEND